MKKEEILANCIEEIRSGKSTVADCIKRYPELGQEFGPMLEIAANLQADDVQPSEEFQQRAKEHILAREDFRPERVISGRWFWPKPVAARVILTVAAGLVVIGAGGAGTAYAAQGSLPGDTLYPVKIGIENLQLAVTVDTAAKANLHLGFAQQRIDEAARQAELDRSVNTQALETVKQQFDSAIKELSQVPDATATASTLSRLSADTLDQQLELDQALARSPGSSQALGRALAETRRENTIAQVAYANPDFLKQQPSVTDEQLDIGQFQIEGTLQSIQGSTWNVGGTVIENVHCPGKPPDLGSGVKLEGLVQANEVFLSRVETTDSPGQTTTVEGQFTGTTENGSANVGGIPVNIDNSSGVQLQPGDNVRLQAGAGNGKLKITGRESQHQGNGNSTSLSGVLTAVDAGSNSITVKMAGNQISINIGEAQIATKGENSRKLSLSDLSHLTGRDIKINGLQKKNGVIFAQQAQISGGD